MHDDDGRAAVHPAEPEAELRSVLHQNTQQHESGNSCSRVGMAPFQQKEELHLDEISVEEGVDQLPDI